MIETTPESKISLEDCPKCSEYQGVIVHSGIKRKRCIVCDYESRIIGKKKYQISRIHASTDVSWDPPDQLVHWLKTRKLVKRNYRFLGDITWQSSKFQEEYELMYDQLIEIDRWISKLNELDKNTGGIANE